MKIIDILNKKANRTLENGFKFIYRNYMYTYNKNDDNIENDYGKSLLGSEYKVEKILNDEVELIEENKEIEEYKTEYTERCIDIEVRNKLNELVRAYNKLIKEREEK